MSDFNDLILRDANRKYITVTQTMEDYGKDAAYRSWMSKLKTGEELPRGKYFRDKQPRGDRRVIVDEAHLLLSGTSNQEEKN